MYGFKWQKNELLHGDYTGNGGNECVEDLLFENTGSIEESRADEPVLMNVLKCDGNGAIGEETALHFFNLGDPYKKRANWGIYA